MSDDRIDCDDDYSDERERRREKTAHEKKQRKSGHKQGPSGRRN